MDRELKKYLDDILNAIDEIESFVSQYPCRYDVFCATPILIRAVQMNIAIIGEATNRILKIRDDISITNARKIVNTRNYLIHGYDSLRYEILWAIVIKDIPLLKAEVKAIIGTEPEQNT
ncbi:MAG: DUF86 domain-containing protein [Duncaniella sp.]|uniref:HepT-like ribonuclease domain-containing protein n=1 Tax=Duncaniella sp. TaxID=2518496 RepID=UPI0023BBED36|nr:HepT-like ribonuclease domain-containing protein [Duncaniella sp.]MDE5988914.1 DUF86 domain-containing protein [Duncaniella sp.]MDE6174770.1 DUF86 domain-containing protein [Duncaniella sp.]